MLTKTQLASIIDQTLLDPSADRGRVEAFCREAGELGFAAVALLPCNVSLARSILQGTNTKVCAALAFPLGTWPAELKAAEARQAVKDGAEELDVVMNVGALKAGKLDQVRAELRGVVEAAEGRTVKVIIELPLLTETEAAVACDLIAEAGAQFVKTSTGFKGFKLRGTTADDVILLKRLAAGRIKVKAAGGIRTYELAAKMVECGVDRIGTSSGVAIVNQCP